MLIDLKLLRGLDACEEGIEDFEKHFGTQSVSVDEVINKALEINYSETSWLIKRFHEYIVELDWSKLSGWGWCCLLLKQPQFSEHCDWSLLSGYDWSRLLSYQPQLSEHCDWSKFTGENWSVLLRNQPQFSEYCDWSKLNGSDWFWLLRNKPQFEKYKDKHYVN